MKHIHKQKEIIINNEKIKVDEKIADIIYNLNGWGYKTLYSCQGDRYNEGYIKFDEKVDIEIVYSFLEKLLPYHVLRLDFHNIIRFANTKQAYLSRYETVKYIKKRFHIKNKK
jgi:hypothetical protein